MIKDDIIIKTLITENFTPNELVGYFLLVIKLKQYHGSLLTDRVFHDILQSVDARLELVVSVLIKTKRLGIKQLKDLIFSTKKFPEYRSELAIVTEKTRLHAIAQYIGEKLPESIISEQDTDDMTLSISGNGWYYKKSFDHDVEKLLA